MDLLIASKTDNFPLFARPRRKVTGLTPQKKQKFVKDCGKILPEVKIDCAISAANSRLRARANEWLFYSRLWGLRSRVTTSRVPEDRFALSFPFHFAFI